MKALVKKASAVKWFSEPRIVQVFLDADLRAGHHGLTEIAKRHNLDLPNLSRNQFVVFVNRAKTMMKCYVEGNTISHTKRDRIDLSALSKLPQAFGYDGELAYDRALKLALEDKLGIKDEETTSVGKWTTGQVEARA